MSIPLLPSPTSGKSPQPAEPTALPPPHRYDSALGRWRHVLFGRPLPTSRADEQKLPNYMALPILSSNALSSNAYATEAILGVLILAKTGTGAFHFAVPIALAICALLIVVTLSYIQVIYAYPEGGGAYPVSRDNLGPVPSLIAGASLMVDYLLTVAVSVAAGVAALIAMFAGRPAGVFLQEHIVAMCLISILALTLANLRGLREAGLLFAIPTYVFIAGILATVAAGLYAMWVHPAYAHPSLQEAHASALKGATSGMQAVGVILILQAFSQGCAALTGMEAISSTVPVFQKPSDKNAVLTMYIMSSLAVIMFAGLTYVADGLGSPVMDASQPGYQSVVSIVADRAWPRAFHWMFYIVQLSTALVLLLAANTAYAGFPQLASMMARDSFLPRQLANIGDRLSYSNGIAVLAIVAAALIVIFHGLVDALLPMYAIGVFIGFTLAQTGMVRRWLRLRTKGWQTSLFFNALGAVATALVVVIIAVSKFDNGAEIGFSLGRFSPHYGVWIVLMLVPAMVVFFLHIHRHYIEMSQELSLDNAEMSLAAPKHNTVLVLLPRMHRGIVEALNYARLTSDDVRAVYIETDPERTALLKKNWHAYGSDIPLVIMESPYRSLIGPLLRYIDAVQKERSDDVITVVLPELVSRKLWHALLHNQAGPLLKLALLNRRDVIVTNVRYFLEH